MVVELIRGIKRQATAVTRKRGLSGNPNLVLVLLMALKRARVKLLVTEVTSDLLLRTWGTKGLEEPAGRDHTAGGNRQRPFPLGFWVARPGQIS